MYTTCSPESANSRAERNSTRKNALFAMPTGKLLIRASTVSHTLAAPVTNPSSSATLHVVVAEGEQRHVQRRQEMSQPVIAPS